ncbi:STAS-like domain-containing protein [Lacrimispora sp. JR3]|uniref:STAS-like domain-containing protein n=1 Tax=Lacrimispora sinapis TaxID=3111456 RepID=UPI0037495A84
MNVINISEVFSNTPGGRYKDEGDFSGEEFRESILLPEYEKVENTDNKLKINFDNCFGFATSFLEESFGGLVRKYKKKNVLSHIEIISNDDETIPKLIRNYVEAAEKKI